MLLFSFKSINSLDAAKLTLRQIANVFIIVGVLEIILSFVPAAIDTKLILLLFGIMWITVGYVVKNYQSRIAAIVLLLNCVYSLYFGIMHAEHNLISTVSLVLRGFLLLLSIRAVQASFAYHKYRH